MLGMAKTRDQLLEEAIGWTIRLRHAGAEDWEAFTQWLEADPHHLAAYEETASADADLERLPNKVSQPTMAADAPRGTWAARRSVLGWGVAAALVAVVGYSTLQSDARYAMETEAGERRSIALADGSSIHLNGSSRVLLDRGDARFARLERGEALFNVVHDASTSFRVEVGDAVVRDLGTVFNVVREPGVTSVEVAEGAVLFDSAARDVTLSQGGTLRQAQGRITTGRRDPSEIGAWRNGQLSYSSASIAEIAADLSRNTGLVVRASPEVAGRKFSGVIVLGSDRAKLLRRVSALLAVAAKPTDEGWVLTAEGR